MHRVPAAVDHLYCAFVCWSCTWQSQTVVRGGIETNRDCRDKDEHGGLSRQGTQLKHSFIDTQHKHTSEACCVYHARSG